MAMNSKIYKRPPGKVEMTDDIVSGVWLARKLEAWCETEPSVLMWEIGFIEPQTKMMLDNNGKQADVNFDDWQIEFQFVRTYGISQNGIFEKAAIIDGNIKSSLEMINGKTQPAYLLKLFSRSIRNEKLYVSAIELWNYLTNLGVQKGGGT